MQHRSPLQGKYKEVQPLLPLLRAGFAVVKEEEMNILENLNANDAAKYVVDVSDTISNFYKTIHSIADKYGIDRDDVMKHALRVFSNMIELGTLFEKMGQTAEWER